MWVTWDGDGRSWPHHSVMKWCKRLEVLKVWSSTLDTHTHLLFNCFHYLNNQQPVRITPIICLDESHEPTNRVHCGPNAFQPPIDHKQTASMNPKAVSVQMDVYALTNTDRFRLFNFHRSQNHPRPPILLLSPTHLPLRCIEIFFFTLELRLTECAWRNETNGIGPSGTPFRINQ